MIPTNKIELKIEKNDKCALMIDSDCSLGRLYDFSCVMKSFFMLKMKEQEDAEAAKKQAESASSIPESA